MVISWKVTCKGQSGQIINIRPTTKLILKKPLRTCFAFLKNESGLHMWFSQDSGKSLQKKWIFRVIKKEIYVWNVTFFHVNFRLNLSFSVKTVCLRTWRSTRNGEHSNEFKQFLVHPTNTIWSRKGESRTLEFKAWMQNVFHFNEVCLIRMKVK